MARDLADKVLVITGASSGIGAATALACARAGMDVMLTGRRAERLAQVAERVRAAGRAAEVLVGDVVDPDLPARLLDAALARFGRFDVVMANAGYGLNSPMHELETAALRRIFEVNFFSAYALLRAAANRLLAARRPGHLLMTSSCVAKFALPQFGAYSSSKAAQNHVCAAMRMELRPHGIEVSSVLPITTETEFFTVAAQMSGQAGAAASPAHQVPHWLVQPPERVARAVVDCLRYPKGEVWTSRMMRTLAGVVSRWPGLMDLVASLPPRK